MTTTKNTVKLGHSGGFRKSNFKIFFNRGEGMTTKKKFSLRIFIKLSNLIRIWYELYIVLNLGVIEKSKTPIFKPPPLDPSCLYYSLAWPWCSLCTLCYHWRTHQNSLAYLWRTQNMDSTLDRNMPNWVGGWVVRVWDARLCVNV